MQLREEFTCADRHALPHKIEDNNKRTSPGRHSHATMSGRRKRTTPNNAAILDFIQKTVVNGQIIDVAKDVVDQYNVSCSVGSVVLGQSWLSSDDSHVRGGM